VPGPALTGGPHVALVGPTASGKSSLAFDLASCRREAEIVSVDSMSVYRHMDIGTAKPSHRDRASVPQHLIDIVDPEEEFTLRDFQDAARAALAQIEQKGHRALLVAGTGLYLRAIVDNLELPGRWPQVSAELEAAADEPGGLELLYQRLMDLDELAARRMDKGNRRRILRALEVTLGSQRPFSSFGPGLDRHLPTPFVLVGIALDPALHDSAIERRFRQMVDDGLVEEVRALARRPQGLSRTARQALGYKEILSHIEEGTALDEALSRAVSRTKVFARRQWRWFRRDPRVLWIDPARDSLKQLLELWDTTALSQVGD